ncbi:hypothetical protein PRVXH_001113 [Proteinivorax hydrogeniformans]|uniref:Uncharacterized protein n=1 Tax=Proteinivorax hydrogeniformans TaxID=1826727 RepID=A0AAU8HWM6_9FIRM
MIIYLLCAILATTVFLLAINIISSKISAIFRHDMANDVQLAKGYITLNKKELLDESIENIHEKLKTFTNVNNSSLVFRLFFVLLYSNTQKKAQSFDIFVNTSIKSPFSNPSMFKSLGKAIIYIKKTSFKEIEIEIDKDLVELFCDGCPKSF